MSENTELLDRFEIISTEYVKTLKECILCMKNERFDREDRERYDAITERLAMSIIDFGVAITQYSENIIKEIVQEGISEIFKRSYDKNR